MGSTCNIPANPCRSLLELCLRGAQWPNELLDRALAVDEGRAFLARHGVAGLLITPDLERYATDDFP